MKESDNKQTGKTAGQEKSACKTSQTTSTTRNQASAARTTAGHKTQTHAQGGGKGVSDKKPGGSC